jgi:hypothetical protein
MGIVLKTTGICFGLLTGLHMLHISDVARWVVAEPTPFWVHATVQLFVEFSLIAAVGWWLQRQGRFFATALWLTMSIWWALLHLMDIHMVRLMDISLMHAARSTLEEGWDNFVEILKASNVPMILYVVLALATIAVSLTVLMGFHRALKREQHLKRTPHPGIGLWTGMACMSLLGASALMDCSIIDGTIPQGMQKLSRALPWKRRAVDLEGEVRLDLCPRPAAWSLPHSSSSSQSPITARLTHRPPVFLFIVESLRADALTAETAPHLTAFAKRYYASSNSYANANATPLSWMAILSGAQPSRWGSSPIANMRGSPALKALKEAGYTLHLHTASRLSYYSLDRKLFGEALELLDSSYESPPELDLEAWERDAQVLAQLQAQTTGRSCTGECHLVFLEGTHFAYSWPEDNTVFEPVSAPAEGVLAFWGLTDLEPLRNRYFNSIHHLDQQMGQFFDHLRRQHLFDRSQIVFTADHGEEFFEQGHLFHASALDREQVHVPIFWKLDLLDRHDVPKDLIVSHVDILPSLVHSLSGQIANLPGSDGRSLLAPRRPAYAISWRYNFQAPPHEFVVHTADSSLRGCLSEPHAASNSTHFILERGRCRGQCVPAQLLLGEQGIQEALETFFTMVPSDVQGSADARRPLFQQD